LTARGSTRHAFVAGRYATEWNGSNASIVLPVQIALKPGTYSGPAGGWSFVHRLVAGSYIAATFRDGFVSGARPIRISRRPVHTPAWPCGNETGASASRRHVPALDDEEDASAEVAPSTPRTTKRVMDARNPATASSIRSCSLATSVDPGAARIHGDGIEDAWNRPLLRS
jgi:hypothetical protein